MVGKGDERGLEFRFGIERKCEDEKKTWLPKIPWPLLVAFGSTNVGIVVIAKIGEDGSSVVDHQILIHFDGRLNESGQEWYGLARN